MYRPRKHVVFYSNFCKHSKEALSLINQRGIAGFFTFVCVDHNRYDIPKVVDRVPMIISNDRRVLADGSLAPFIMAVQAPPIAQAAAVMAQRSPAASAAVDAFSLGASGLSEGFSFIGGEEECRGEFCRGFAFLNEDTSISTTQQQTEAKERLTVNLDRLISDRNKDVGQ